MELKRKKRINWRKDEDCRIIKKHPCVVVLNPKFEKKEAKPYFFDEQSLQTGASPKCITTEPKQTSPQIKEEICEEIVKEHERQIKKRDLEPAFGVFKDMMMYFGDKNQVRIVFNGASNQVIKGSLGLVKTEYWGVYGRLQSLEYRKKGMVERIWDYLLNQIPLEKKIDEYYEGSEVTEMAKIYPDEKKIVVIQSLLYDHLKHKGEQNNYKVIVKCWEGAI